jgi:methionyl-tRNA formyltransferase
VPLRLVFMGTPHFAVPVLTEIAARGHEVAAVYTRCPQPAGRGMSEQPSPVHEKARELGTEIVMPRTLRIKAAQEHFSSHQADAAVVVAYGLILPKPVLDAPRLGCLNLHASALPRWRGAAPIQRAIMAGDNETAVMVMRMEEGLDTGPVCLEERVSIGAEETARELSDRLAVVGAGLMARALDRLERGDLHCTPQGENGVTYATKIEKSEARVDWRRPASTVLNQIRGLSPAPGAWFEMPGGKRIERVRALRAGLVEEGGAPGQVLSLDPLVVACGEGAITLRELQRAGGKPIPADAFVRGTRLSTESVLS